MHRYLVLAVSIPAMALLLGCPSEQHPNQIDAFDGKTYDTLLIAHEALGALRPTVVSHTGDFAASYNASVSAYSDAFDVYSRYRQSPMSGQQPLVLLISSLASSVAALEDKLTRPLPVPAPQRQRITAQYRVAGTADVQQISAATWGSILDALTLAAEISATVPQSSEYGKLAEQIIAATRFATTAAQQNRGEPIDLARITPLEPISDFGLIVVQ
jgi:hypothetical protein